MEKHIFWDNQPVSRKNDDKVGTVDKNYLKVSTESETILPEALNWCHFDIDNPEDFKEFHQFLFNNYNSEKEDFRLGYTPEIIRWSLDLDINAYKVKKLDSLKSWFIGLKSESNKLIGVITATPVNLRIQGKNVETAIVNHLCVVNKLRSKGVAGFLIKELIRTVRLTNPKLLTAPIFTSNDLPFNSIVSVKMYTRYLNIDNLIKTGYINKEFTNNTEFKNFYQQFNIEKNINISAMKDTDIKSAYNLLKSNLDNYDLTMNFTNIKQFTKYFENKFDENNNLLGPIYSFVIKDEEDQVTDFISFYYLPYLTKNNKLLKPVHILRIERSKTELIDLLNYIFLIAKEMGFDIFNFLECFGVNDKNIKELRMEQNIEKMTYYTYNYNCGDVSPDNLGVIIP